MTILIIASCRIWVYGRPVVAIRYHTIPIEDPSNMLLRPVSIVSLLGDQVFDCCFHGCAVNLVPLCCKQSEKGPCCLYDLGDAKITVDLQQKEEHICTIQAMYARITRPNRPKKCLSN